MKKILTLTLFLALITYSCTSSQADFGVNRKEETMKYDSDLKAREGNNKIMKAEKAGDVH